MAENELEERMEEMSSAQIAHLREKSQTDLFFLSKWVLNYDQLCESAHAALCKFMVVEERTRRMVLMPRGHLKTTVCTISDSIRLALKNPCVRILIQNEVLDNAADMLSELKGHWTKEGGMLPMLFPELVPPQLFGRGSDWSKEASSIVRPRHYKESTWTASGSGGSPQSKHFNFIKNDDLIGEKHKESELEMARAIRWSNSMEPLLDAPAYETIDYYGTRKTMSDVYAHRIELEGANLAVFVREPIEGGESIFPLKYPLWKLEDIMVKTPELWAHDYMNNPIGKGGLDWGKGYLRMFEIRGDKVVFEHNITGELVYWKLDELDVVITADPNSGKLLGTDKAAICVHGVSPEEQIFVLDSWSARVSPDGFQDMLMEKSKRWRPRVVGIEEAGQQTSLYYFEKRCLQESNFFWSKALQHKNEQKDKRIRSNLDIPLKARRIYVQHSQRTLIGQIQLFPQLQAHNWDEIDAFAYGPQLYGKGTSEQDQREAEEAEEKLLAARGITGYGESY